MLAPLAHARKRFLIASSLRRQRRQHRLGSEWRLLCWNRPGVYADETVPQKCRSVVPKIPLFSRIYSGGAPM